MSYAALYRTYRPKTFNDVVGQDHVITALEGGIAKEKIAHAYLFSGSRGIGKTSIARIFAREIGTSENDLYEIDAASNRGIDDIRAIREAVQTLPFESKYKVYIIDEVHMLTKEAFNALLKTLEEPPRHIVFILATTEIEKLPDTIVSRCQVFDFKMPSEKILSDVVKNIAKKEGYTIDNEVADMIAQTGSGAYRDALGILQKVIGASKDKKITLEDTQSVLGTPSKKLVFDYIEALLKHDSEKGIKVLQNAKEKGVSMKFFAELFLVRLRLILLLRFAPSEKDGIKRNFQADFDVLEKFAKNIEYKIDSRFMLKAIESVELTKKSSIPELPLELLLIKED